MPSLKLCRLETDYQAERYWLQAQLRLQNTRQLIVQLICQLSRTNDLATNLTVIVVSYRKVSNSNHNREKMAWVIIGYKGRFIYQIPFNRKIYAQLKPQCCIEPSL